MRSDLAKLTTEKERCGSSSCYSKKYGGKVYIVHNQEHDYEDEFGGFISSARHRHPDNKSFSDVLSPIRGALRKNVGRPWDKVYSEFCQFLDRRSVSGIHIFGHLCGRGGEVTINGLYVGDDGKVYEYPNGGYFSPKSGVKYREIYEVTGFYVHPKTGILCYKAPNYGGHHHYLKGELNALRDNNIDIAEKKYRVINGCWFEVWLVEGLKEDWRPCWNKSVVTEDHVKHYQCVQHKKTGEFGYWHLTKTMIVDRKRSLNSKEIKMVKKYQLRRIKEIEEDLR